MACVLLSRPRHKWLWLEEVHLLYENTVDFSSLRPFALSTQGSLVRAFRRTEEILRQLISGAKVIGEADLAGKFEECSASIKRGVVFAASLYL